MGWPEKDLGDVSKFPRIKADFTKPQGAKAVVDAFVSAGYDAAEVELDAGEDITRRYGNIINHILGHDRPAELRRQNNRLFLFKYDTGGEKSGKADKKGD